MRQRSCRVVLGFNDQLRADLNDAILTDRESGDVGDPLMASGVPSPQPEDHCFPKIKKGINLPKSEEQWLTANEYFKSVLSLNPPITVQNVSSRVKLLNDTVYDSFSANFGQVGQAPDAIGAPNDNFRENICSEDDLRSRIFGAFVVKFLACLPLLGFSNIYKMV